MMKTRAPEFDEMTTYVQTLNDKLGVIERISQRIIKEQNGNIFSFMQLWNVSMYCDFLCIVMTKDQTRNMLCHCSKRLAVSVWIVFEQMVIFQHV